ncbi:MAG: N-acetylmuramoyl-L-alanine amidase [Oscillospiraceae bacterium]|nr:N-acetylmuramoyl-L-alanine amidase [Oscillospiraceae bacterium]
MKRINKYFIFGLLMLSLNLVSSASSDTAISRMLYEDKGMFILTHPQEDSSVTASPRTSFLGTADTLFPLYINGEEINMTKNGFWSYYAVLDIGENIFSFENGDYYESVTVIREEPEAWIPPETVYFTIELYGSTESIFISRFSDLNDDLYMRTPLAQGTTFRIIAEYGDFYIIEDGTAVFKSNVYQLDRMIPPITVSGGEISAEDNSVTLSLGVTDNPLYEVILDSENRNKAVLLLYADEDEIDLQPDGNFITEINKIETDYDSPLIYELVFEREPVGFMVDFSDGKMNLRFRFAAGSLSDSYVLLDAGHGGHLPGALGPPGEYGPMEKDINLYVSEITRDYLEARGIRTVLIRDKDEDVPIMDRVQYFNGEPDISVCIHANSMSLSSDFSSERGPLMFYTLDLSEKAADDMIKIIAEHTGNPYTPPKRQNFAMARYTGSPSMLFEMGFMCNPEEYEDLINTEYLNKMGEALGLSIIGYLEQYVQVDEYIDVMQYTAYEEEDKLPTETDIEVFASYLDEPDAQPVLQQTSGVSGGDFNNMLGKYIILISGVLLCGAMMWLPSFLRKGK